MNTPIALIALCACVLALSACDKTQPIPPAPTVNKPLVSESVATAGSVDPSVPSTESVLAPAGASKADPTVGRSTNTTLSAAQESTAMPMPGQNNDHSAPVGPAKGASAPSLPKK